MSAIFVLFLIKKTYKMSQVDRSYRLFIPYFSILLVN